MDNEHPLKKGEIITFRTGRHHPVSTLVVRYTGSSTHKALIIDGSATVDPYWMVRVCKKHGFNERSVINRIFIARGFTAYQVKELVSKASVMLHDDRDIKMLGGIAISERFADDDVKYEEGTWLRSQTVKCIRQVVKECDIYCAVADVMPEIYTRRTAGELHG